MNQVKGSNLGGNRLSDETSPYLLHHATNPVDWFPWGEAAFDKARHDDKPIFLSVGYSACHWCHVMERESFENVEIAAILNRWFVSIKVDREERPDVDAIYMDAVQMMTGSGGWPMSVFMTPDLKPFYAGTYFPPVSHYGLPSFKDVLTQIADAWQHRREQLLAGAGQVTDALTKHVSSKNPAGGEDGHDADILETAVTEILKGYDPAFGGFGNAPKFPPHGTVELLFRRSADKSDRLPAAVSSEKDNSAESLASPRSPSSQNGCIRDTCASGAVSGVGNNHDDHSHSPPAPVTPTTESQAVLDAGVETLRKMACGGIYDQVGGGFHRYSVDAQWLVPHFEKMLYDNALLVPVFLDAWQITGDPFFSRIAAETLDFMIRDMQDDSGGFHSTLDADSEGEEGKYYVWTAAEIDAVLADEHARLIRSFYSVTRPGNFEGKNILHVKELPAAFARRHHVEEGAFLKILQDARRRLYDTRATRIPPEKDDKCLTGWNGLALTAFARGYAIQKKQTYLEAATGVVSFLRQHMLQPDGMLLRSFRHGRARLPGYLDDYAYVARGLVDLFLSTADPAHLELAETILARMFADFADPQGGFFFTADYHPHLIVRRKEYLDHAIPAPAIVAGECLHRLDRLRGTQTYSDHLEKTLAGAVQKARQHPAAYSSSWNLLDRILSAQTDIFAIRGEDESDTLLALLRQTYLPNALTLMAGNAAPDRLGKQVPMARNRPAVDGKTTVYICKNRTCLAPITEIKDFSALLS